MNDAIADLIREYKSFNASQGFTAGFVGNTVEKLGRVLHPDVVDFFIEVLAQPGRPSDELPRVRVLQTLERSGVSDATQYRALGELIRRLTLHGESHLVRYYAILAASNFPDIENMFEVIAGILLDSDAHEDMRSNAFLFFQRQLLPGRARPVIEALLGDRAFATAAKDLLNRWRHQGGPKD